MGDRVSISFADDHDESIALFHHWGGTLFPEMAQKFINELPPKQGGTPQSRREPKTMMVQFILWLQETGHDFDSIYLGKNSGDGDNSDNGHFIINVETGGIQ